MQAADLVLTERRQFSAESNLSGTKSTNQVNLDSIMSEVAPMGSAATDDKFSFKLTQISDQQKGQMKAADTVAKETSPAKLSRSKTLRTELADQMNAFESLLIQHSAACEQNSEMASMLKMLQANFKSV